MIRPLHVFISPGSFLLLVLEAFLVSAAFILAAYFAAVVDPADYLLYNYGLVSIGTVVLTFVLGLYFDDLYAEVHIASRVLLLQRLVMVTGVAFLVQGLLSYINVDLRIPVPIMLVGSAMAVPAVFLERLLFNAYAVPMVARTKVLMIGNSPVLLAVGDYIREHPEVGLYVGEYLAEQDVGRLSDLVKEVKPSRVVLGLSAKPDTVMAAALMDTRYGGFDIESAAITYERICGRVRLEGLQPEQVVYSGTFQFQPQYVSYQVFLRGLLAGIVVILALPVGLLAALILKASTPGPVFSRQVLAGMNGKPFQAYEFCVTKATWAARMIERFHVARLPRLLNVLRGEMAIVGPAPEKPAYVDALSAHIPFYRERYTVRPGITGWAQIRLLGIPLEDTFMKLEYDFYYIKHMSLGLDTLILLQTIKSVFMSFEEE